MGSSSDAAETVLRMTLQGTEFALKITGTLTKHLMVGLYTACKNREQTQGKTSLKKMLKSGRELKVFSIKAEDLKLFEREAKRYGILYTTLVDKKNLDPDGMVDILTRSTDAPRVNRIIKRFKIFTCDTAEIKSQVVNSRDTKSENDKGFEGKDIEDMIVDDILSKPTNKEENEMSNPEVAKMEKDPLSEHSSTNKKPETGTKPTNKKSVREEIKNIKEEQQKNVDLGKTEQKKNVSTKETKHQQPKNKKKKIKERGK